MTILALALTLLSTPSTRACPGLVDPPPLASILNLDPHFTLELSGSGRFACEDCTHASWSPELARELPALRYSTILLTDLAEFAAGGRSRAARRIILQAFAKLAAGARVILISADPELVARATETTAVHARALDLDAYGLIGRELHYRPRSRK